MADVRPTAAPTVPNLPAAPRGAARASSVRAAQAAFFQAASTGEATRPPSAASAVKPVTAATGVAAGFDPAAPQPGRILRPGSLVDLKV